MHSTSHGSDARRSAVGRRVTLVTRSVPDAVVTHVPVDVRRAQERRAGTSPPATSVSGCASEREREISHRRETAPAPPRASTRAPASRERRGNGEHERARPGDHDTLAAERRALLVRAPELRQCPTTPGSVQPGKRKESLARARAR